MLARVGKRVVHWDEQGDAITIEACSSVRAAPCPTCRSWSSRRHGSCVRRLEERPVLEQQVVFSIEMRRFKCLNAACPVVLLPRTSIPLPVDVNVERGRRLGHCMRWAARWMGRRQPDWPLP